MVRNILCSAAGLMLIAFPSWGQVTEDFLVLDEVVVEVTIPEELRNKMNLVDFATPLAKIDRMPIVKPNPGFQSNMEILNLSPDGQAKMPIYNDLTEMDVLADFKPSSLPLRIDSSKFDLDLPKFEAPVTYYPIGK